MAEVLVKLKGAPEIVLNRMIREGYFGSKSDAIRMGIVLLGKELGLLSEEELVSRKVASLEKRRKAGKLKTVSWEKVKKDEGL